MLDEPPPPLTPPGDAVADQLKVITDKLETAASQRLGCLLPRHLNECCVDFVMIVTKLVLISEIVLESCCL